MEKARSPRIHVVSLIHQCQGRTEIQDIRRYSPPHPQSDFGSIIWLGNSLFPRTPHTLRLSVPGILLLGKSTSSDSRPHSARHLDLPQFPTLGRSQHFQLCLVDVLSNPGYRGIHRDQRGSADHSGNQSVAVWDLLVVFQYPTCVRS